MFYIICTEQKNIRMKVLLLRKKGIMKMEEISQTDQTVMQIIMSAGNAKGIAYEALKLAKSDDFDGSREKLKEANEVITEAHNAQSQWLAAEARGEAEQITALFVHAQDHLMTTMTEMNFITEIIELREEISQNK